MKEIEINEYFKKSYLTCGITRDNFIFENCLKSFMLIAEKSLKDNQNNTQSCCIKITRDIEEDLVQTLSQTENDFQKKIIAREFVSTLFMLQLIKNTPQSKLETNLKNGLSAILSGDFEKTKKYISSCPTPLEIQNLIRKLNKIELNIFLYDTQNKHLQQAINNYISSRLPYSIKVFSNKNLSSYLDQNGNRIENPHDYMSINLNSFIKIKDIKEKQ